MAFAPKRLIPLVLLFPAAVGAQQGRAADTLPPPPPAPTPSRTHYWRNMALGFTSSILLHELGHITAALALGARPRLGMDKGRPTIYSGIDPEQERRKQFIFSSAGLNVQAVLDEAILDIPHAKGSPFERGILAGGIATAFFYATIGKNASNSDITYMARTSSLNKTQASLIYAGIAAVHTIRIARDGHYANFFLRPSPTQGMRIGIVIRPE